MPWSYAAAAVGTYLGSREAGKGASSAARTQAEAVNRAVDYQQDVEALPLEIRNEFMPMVADYYRGGEGQQQFIDATKSSPFYNQMLQVGQEGVMANAGSKGLTRSGNTARDLSQSNQMVLNNAVNQRLQGMSAFSRQGLNTNAIANSMGDVGNILAQGQVAEGQSNQDMLGDIGNIIAQAVSEGG